MVSTALSASGLTEDSFFLSQDAKRLFQIGQSETVDLHRAGNAGLCDFNLSLFRVGVAFCDFSPRAQFPRKRQLLGGSDANVGKVAVGVSRDGFGLPPLNCS